MFPVTLVEYEHYTYCGLEEHVIYDLEEKSSLFALFLGKDGAQIECKSFERFVETGNVVSIFFSQNLL